MMDGRGRFCACAFSIRLNRQEVLMFGVRVQKTHKEAMEIDEENGNTRWADSEEQEVDELNSLHSFRSIGRKAPTPRGYTRIPVFFVYAVKETGRYKSRLVAGGHVLPPPIESVYSGVISLMSIRLICFAGILNNLELMGTDISNPYLEAYTGDPLVFRVGPEFGELEGHTMVVVKAHYGIPGSGKQWAERFAANLSDRKDGFPVTRIMKYG